MWMQDVNGVAVNLNHCRTIFLTDKDPAGLATDSWSVIAKGEGFSAVLFTHNNENDAREAFKALCLRVQVFQVRKDGAFYKA